MSNILIHPNSGLIEFSTGTAGGNTFNANFTGGANAVRFGYDNIGGLNITNYSTGVSGINRFSVDGANGRLFSVTDSLSGSLFSVNDIAGLPIIEAFDDNTVIMGAFNRNDFVLTGNSLGLGGIPNTGTTKLFVSGNVNVSGNVTANNLVFNTGSQTISGLKTFATGISAPNLVFNTGDQTISGIKTFATGVNISGQVELSTNQTATTANSAMTRVLADKNIMFDVAKVRILPPANMTYNTTGAGAAALSNIDGTTLTGSTTASAFTRAALTRQWTTFPGITGVNNTCSAPVAFAFMGAFYCPAINTVIRFIVGDAGSGAPALPSANAISGRGFGFEIFFDSVPKIRLFAHDGTNYTTSSAVNSGTSFDVNTSLLISSDGVGNLKLFIANSSSIAQRISETPTLTHTGAPTSSTYAGAFASILTANNTTAPLLQPLVRISQTIIHIDQLY